MMRTSGPERRREPRHPATGQVTLTLTDPLTVSFDGELVDLSKNGFRAMHRNPDLQTGQEVRFQHPSRKGHAKVMWSRILGGQVESGFLVL